LEKILVGFFGFAVMLILNFLNAWFVMLGLGAANQHWANVPALGYWDTWLILVGIAAVAGSIHGGMRVKLKED
jgi:uncharacterized membrane protein (DUF485 family)